MDHRRSLLLTLLLGVYTLNECAAFEPAYKGKSLKDYYNEFLVYLDVGYGDPKPMYSTLYEIDEKTVNEVEKTTLCGIQTVCLSILQASRWQPNKLKAFFGIPLDILVILYNMNAVHDARVVYPLWLFSMYVNNYVTYAEKLNVRQILHVHEMITEQLELSMSGCPDGNRFAVIENGLDEHQLSAFTNRIIIHFDNIRWYLKRTTVANRSYERIDAVNWLSSYAYTILYNHKIRKMTTKFGNSGEWGNVSRVFFDAHVKATDPGNLYNRMQGIGDYRILFLTLLKMIMLRMVCIHLLLVTDHDHRLEWNGLMLKTVASFVDKTGLKDDETFVKTFRVLGDECPSPENSKAVIDCIRSDLATSSTAFEGCNVSTIAEEDLPRIFDNVAAGEEELPAYIKTNFGLAVRFVGKVEDCLLYFDQEFIKSVLALAYPIDGNFEEYNLPSFCKNNNQR